MAVDLSNPEFLASVKARERQRSGKGMGRFALALVLLLLYLTPFYYLFVTVFKTTPEYAQKGVLELPDSLAPFIDNVVQAWTLAGMSQAMFNSLTYSLFGSILAVALAAAAAYGLTRLGLRSANGWFMLIFAGTLFPFQMYLVPLFFGYQRLGLINSWLGMLLIYTAICIPFPLLVLRNSFATISKEIDEAAALEVGAQAVVAVGRRGVHHVPFLDEDPLDDAVPVRLDDAGHLEAVDRLQDLRQRRLGQVAAILEARFHDRSCR